MQQLIIILLKSIACAGVLFGYYLLFLRGKKLHNYNRWYLLSATALSLVIPFLSFKSYVLTSPSSRDIVLLNAIETGKEYEVMVNGTSDNVISTATMAGYVCLFVSALLSIMLVIRVAWVYRLKRKGQAEQKDGYRLIYTDSPQAPFSFFNNLFWKHSIDIDSTAGQQILKHELSHIRQCHTIDKLFMQLVLIIAWANPFFWLIRKELAMQHEFIADDAAISGNDTDAFARMILQAKYTNISPDIIHPFFHSSIKRRLIMLTNNKKTGFSKLRRLAALPLAASVLLLLSFKLDVSKVNRANKAISVTFDAGHGGKDPGATGVNGVKEKDLNLKVCKKLVQLAGEYNINARLTRIDDSYPTLEERVALSDEYATDVFISIHVNKKVAGEVHSNYEVVFSGRNKFPVESRALGSAITNRLKTLRIDPSFAQRGLHVVNESNRPALLIECGDIDNAEQMAMLTDDVRLEKFCRHILSGIADYGNSSK